MTLVLVDSSAWVSFFRGDAEAVSRIDPFLAEGVVAINRAVYAEVVSGARTSRDFELLKDLLKGLEWLPEPEDLWERLAEYRFALARRGRQSALVDLMVGIAAMDSGALLLTRDRDFSRIQTVLPLELELF
ncbi:MAG: PIN domain-containing protein [Acidobacteriota bacterium]